MSNPRYTLHEGDLAPDVAFSDAVAVDTETMGLCLARDRLCLVQLSGGDGDCHIVRFKATGSPPSAAQPPFQPYNAPNLKAVLENPKLLKLFHFARFDLAALSRYLGARCQPVYCSRTASKLARTYSDRHGLKELCRELLNIDISKREQSSDWGRNELNSAQLRYAAGDVLHLHKLREHLNIMLEREGRKKWADACFAFLPIRAELDLAGWGETDIFAHSKP